MSDSPTIADGKVVTIHYRLSLDDGTVVSDTAGGEPMAYLHGSENVIPGLEAALAGRSPGDEVNAKIEPADAYGERDPSATEQIPRSAFPGDLELQVGMHLSARHESGAIIPMTVQSIADDAVTVDLNHPLAGQKLHFDVSVVEVRDATEEERSHGHVHGPGGHQH
jgi:FKBP-type peptidyl-prolyl cis-trans isomerase SlyD